MRAQRACCVESREPFLLWVINSASYTSVSPPLSTLPGISFDILPQVLVKSNEVYRILCNTSTHCTYDYVVTNNWSDRNPLPIIQDILTHTDLSRPRPRTTARTGCSGGTFGVERRHCRVPHTAIKTTSAGQSTATVGRRITTSSL